LNAGRKRQRMPENPRLSFAPPPPPRDAEPAQTVEVVRQERADAAQRAEEERKVGERRRAREIRVRQEREAVREHEERERVQHNLETLRNLARETEGFNIRGIGGDDNNDAKNTGDGDDEDGGSDSEDDDEFEDNESEDEEEDLDLRQVRRVICMKPKTNSPLGIALKKKQDYFTSAAGLAELSRGKQWYLPESDPVSRSCYQPSQWCNQPTYDILWLRHREQHT
jgi:hypothetical protein